MHRYPFVWIVLAAMMFVSACSHRSVVALVPDPDGAVGQVTVSNAAGSIAIDQANQTTVIRDVQTVPSAPTTLDAAQLEKLFGAVVNTPMQPPIHFILHFQSDSDQLLPVSREALPKILTAIAARMPTRVSVIGHTDTVGNKAYNVALSMRRAQAVRKLLVDSGIADGMIDVSSHGEENLLIKTADNVANAQNRRVEVVVR